jgi:hypothetical protein
MQECRINDQMYNPSQLVAGLQVIPRGKKVLVTQAAIQIGCQVQVLKM